MAVSAGLPSCVVSLLPRLGAILPIWATNLPSSVNFRIALSLSALPPTQTKPRSSTSMPCSRPTHSYPSPAPPHDRSRLPSLSNSSTGGADTQHLERGGVRLAPFSSSVSERGRWITQMWPCQSTVMPPTWPRIQLFGNGFGQDASTAKVGTSPAVAAPGSANATAAIRTERTRETFASARVEPARFRHGAMATSLFWPAACCRLSAGSQSRGGRQVNQAGERKLIRLRVL